MEDLEEALMGDAERVEKKVLDADGGWQLYRRLEMEEDRMMDKLSGLSGALEVAVKVCNTIGPQH